MVTKLNFFIVFLLTLLFFIFESNKSVIKKPINKSDLTQTMKDFPNNNVETILTNFNQKNSLIHNLTMQITIRDNFRSLNSSVFYEKPQKIRMYTYSILGLEGDIGSNDNLFWFWSKRYQPSALFYSKHEDIDKTRLKYQYKPNFLIDNLSVNQLNVENSSLFLSDNKLKIINKDKEFTIVKVLNIDKLCLETLDINKNNKQIYSFTIEKYQKIYDDFYYPQIIKVKIYDEDLTCYWYLDKPVFNQIIDDKHWILPNIKPQINLIDY